MIFIFLFRHVFAHVRHPDRYFTQTELVSQKWIWTSMYWCVLIWAAGVATAIRKLWGWISGLAVAPLMYHWSLNTLLPGHCITGCLLLHFFEWLKYGQRISHCGVFMCECASLLYWVNVVNEAVLLHCHFSGFKPEQFVWLGFFILLKHHVDKDVHRIHSF